MTTESNLTTRGGAVRANAVRPVASGAVLPEPLVSGGVTASSRGDATETNELLRALLAVNGRLAFPEERLRLLVSPTDAAVYLQAYRMCDGRTLPSEIVEATGLDKGSLSKAMARWVEAGILFRVGPKRFPLHLYPLSADEMKPRARTSETSATGAPARADGRRARGRASGARASSNGASASPSAEAQASGGAEDSAQLRVGL